MLRKSKVFDIDFSFHFNRFTKLEFLIKLGFERKIYISIYSSHVMKYLEESYKAKKVWHLSDTLYMCAFESLGGTRKVARFDQLFGEWLPQIFKLFLESIEHLL